MRRLQENKRQNVKAPNVSLWRQIGDTLANEIERRILQGGDRLPTDIELAQRFGCNKHTARRAVGYLAEQGIVRVEWGRGTFVVEGLLEYRLGAQTRFTQNLLDQRRTPRRKVLRTEELPATETVARGLKIAVGSPCRLLVLLGEADEVPLSLGFNYFPIKRLMKLTAAIEKLPGSGHSVSITELLSTAGITSYRRAHTKIGARLPSAEEAAQLRMARQQPLLETESIDVDRDDHPVTYANTCFRADRLQFVIPT
jgi:GntR family transcriptional regulator, phosphonate transport system regulatory protein